MSRSIQQGKGKRQRLLKSQEVVYWSACWPRSIGRGRDEGARIVRGLGGVRTRVFMSQEA